VIPVLSWTPAFYVIDARDGRGRYGWVVTPEATVNRISGAPCTTAAPRPVKPNPVLAAHRDCAEGSSAADAADGG